MKKILLLLSVLILSSISIYSQESSEYDWALSSDQSVVLFQGDAADVIGAGDSVWFYTVKRIVPKKQIQNVYVSADSVKAGGTVTFTLFDKETYNSDYAGIDTVTWYVTSSDTSFSLSSSTYSISDYTKIHVKGSDDTTGAKITKLDIKFVEE